MPAACVPAKCVKQLNYKAPAFADQFVVVHTRLTKVDGRKAFSEGDMTTLDGELLVNAK
jgi:acyl-CoA thioesterase FadM